MIKISRISIGIRPSNKMFRVASLGGMLIDNILDLRGGKLIHNNFFSDVSKTLEKGSVCSGQVFLATVLYSAQYSFSATFGERPLLC